MPLPEASPETVPRYGVADLLAYRKARAGGSPGRPPGTQVDDEGRTCRNPPAEALKAERPLALHLKLPGDSGPSGGEP